MLFMLESADAPRYESGRDNEENIPVVESAKQLTDMMGRKGTKVI
jgi:hypothetical protein